MTHRRFLVLPVLMLACLVSVFAADITGKWTADIESPMGVMATTFEFNVDASALTGKVITERGETEIKEGKVSGDSISFIQVIEGGPMPEPMRIEYSGTVSGDEINFTRKVGDFGESEFVAKRAK